MALNNFKCNHLMPLHFKGLMTVLPHSREPCSYCWFAIT